MGNCCNSEKVYVPRTEIDKRLVHALQVIDEREADQNAGKHNAVSFERVALQFPKVRRTLGRVKVVFHEYDADGNGTIDVGELQECMRKLGAHMTQEEVGNLFELSDQSRRGNLTFKEFVTALCIGVVLNLIPGITLEHNSTEATGASDGDATVEGKVSTTAELNALGEAAYHVVKAWTLFDISRQGVIRKAEVKKTLAATSNKKKQRGSRLHLLSEARWQEMDWDSDGSIVFPEFVMSYMDWAGVENGDEG